LLGANHEYQQVSPLCQKLELPNAMNYLPHVSLSVKRKTLFEIVYGITGWTIERKPKVLLLN
jgi:hypothetical protein